MCAACLRRLITMGRTASSRESSCVSSSPVLSSPTSEYSHPSQVPPLPLRVGLHYPEESHAHDQRATHPPPVRHLHRAGRNWTGWCASLPIVSQEIIWDCLTDCNDDCCMYDDTVKNIAVLRGIGSSLRRRWCSRRGRDGWRV